MAKENKKDWGKIKEDSETLDVEMNSKQEDESFADEQGAESLEHPDYTALEEQLTLAEQKAHENWEKSVRALAELDNVRRRAERDVENAHRYGAEKLINSLLPVLDSLEQAVQLAEESKDKSMREGLELTMKLFLGALDKAGVQQINPEGAAFDPQQHEAMSIQENQELPVNTVLAVFQKGYLLNERVIRPARVIVSKK